MLLVGSYVDVGVTVGTGRARMLRGRGSLPPVVHPGSCG